MNRRSLLSTPYIIWIVGFTVLPLIVIFKYALTNQAGNFTFENITAIFDTVHIKAMVASLGIAL